MGWTNKSSVAIKSFFEAPLGETLKNPSRKEITGNCEARELCLMTLVAQVPGEAVEKVGSYAYETLRSIAGVICQLFRAIAFRKGACKALVERFWTVIDCLAAIAITLLSSIIKAIRCAMGAVFHPAIAAKKA